MKGKYYNLEIGDEVVVNISKESRDWGYNPFLDGTKAKIVGFAEIYHGHTGWSDEPGVYENRHWLTLELADGHRETIGAFHDIKPTDENVYSRPPYRGSKRLRDLPETKFWEGDFVKSLTQRIWDTNVFTISRINYDYINKQRDDGSPMPIYDVNPYPDQGGTTAMGEDELSLISRGNVWKYYHNIPIEFASIAEEARFYNSIGRTQ